MGDPASFQAFLARQEEAEAALVQGDVEPRLALWSRRDPVSLLGAWGPNKTGWLELERTFRWVADRLGTAERRDFRFDVDVAEVSADGQMAYSIGFERFDEVLADGGMKPWTVRVTHVYRWEDDDWRIVHRHGDLAPIDESRPRNSDSPTIGPPPFGRRGRSRPRTSAVRTASGTTAGFLDRWSASRRGQTYSRRGFASVGSVAASSAAKPAGTGRVVATAARPTESNPRARAPRPEDPSQVRRSTDGSGHLPLGPDGPRPAP